MFGVVQEDSKQLLKLSGRRAGLEREARGDRSLTLIPADSDKLKAVSSTHHLAFT